MDLLLSLLKFTGITLTGAFAIPGLLVEYRDKSTGKINQWGKIALIGILASTTLAISTHGVEQWKDQQSQQEAAKKTLTELQRHSVLLSEISKSLQPLKEMKLLCWVGVEVEGTDFANYKARVRRGVNQFLQKYANWEAASKLRRQESLRLSSGDSNGEIRSLVFDEKSSLYPKSASEGLAYSALNLRVHVCLRKVPVASPHPCSYWGEGGDLRFLASEKSPNSKSEIEVAVSTNSLTVCGRDLIQDSEFTRSNGKLLAVQQFPEHKELQ